MKRRPWLALALVLLVLIAVAAAFLWKTRQADDADDHLAVPSGVVFKKNVPYCLAEGQTLQLDLAEPDSRSVARPAVVLIHGGAWMFGQRNELRSMQLMLAQQGFVAISVDYRLAPQAVFPQPLHDVQCAVRWLRSQSAALAIAPDHISAWGHSAGAHLAALLAVTANRTDLQGQGQIIDLSGVATASANHNPAATGSHVNAVVAHSGIYDLVAALDPSQNVLADAQRGAVAMAGGREVDVLKRASIAPYVHPQAAPVLVLHGDNDRVAPLSQGLQLNDALQASGARSQLFVVRGAGHNDLGAQSTRVLAEVVVFLQQGRP